MQLLETQERYVLSSQNFALKKSLDYQILVTFPKMKNHEKKHINIMGNHFESFIESTVSKGGFSNASEEARAGLRLLEEEESRIIILQNAIREGIESDHAVDFDPKKHLKTLKSGKK